MSTRHSLQEQCLRALILAFFTLAAMPSLAAPSDHFVTTWDTSLPGSSNSTSITVPMIGGPYDVDWNNDGTFDETGLSGSVTHDFGSSGIYTIRIQGSYDSIRFFGGGDAQKIIRQRSFAWISGAATRGPAWLTRCRVHRT